MRLTVLPKATGIIPAYGSGNSDDLSFVSLIKSWQSSLSYFLSLCPRTEFGFDASLRIYCPWYHMHCGLQLTFPGWKAKKWPNKEIVDKELISFIGNPEQIWTNSVSAWSCCPSVPAVVEGLAWIQREQKWNSGTWIKQKPPNVCLKHLMVWFVSYFLNFLSLRESKLKSFPQLMFCR